MAEHHARLAVEPGEAADDRGVVCVAAIPMELAKIAEQRADVIERVGTLGMACNLRNLPGGELGVDFLGQKLTLFREPRNFVRDVDGRIFMNIAELVDLLLQLGNRLLEVEESLFHARIPYVWVEW